MKTYKRPSAARGATEPGNFIVRISCGDEVLYVADVPSHGDMECWNRDPETGTRSYGTVVVGHLATGNHNRCDVTQKGRRGL